MDITCCILTTSGLRAAKMKYVRMHLAHNIQDREILSVVYNFTQPLYNYFIPICLIVPVETFLSSNKSNCLKSTGDEVDMMPPANFRMNLTFEQQCKFAYVEYFAKYNGEYQGNFFNWILLVSAVNVI